MDINPELLEHIEASANRDGIGNIQTVLGAADDSKIPEPVDLIFLCDTLHHIEDRQSYLNHLSARLKPSGRVAVIDFSDVWPIGHGGMRFSDEELDGWMVTIGFEKVQSFDFLPDNFFVLYQKTE